MASKQLKVLLAGHSAGTLLQNETGQLTFCYDEAYSGVALSTSMPISNRTYSDSTVRPFLFGVLPDDIRVRRSLGAEFGVSPNNPFALLEHVGLDCPGAVQFCSEASISDALNRTNELRPLDAKEMARRLRLGRQQDDVSWICQQEHWSLGGQQSKFALRWENGRWNSCLGSAASTHIIKCGIGTLYLQALNEFISLKLASTCGIPSVSVAYQVFEGEPAIIIERYDRTRGPQGHVVRLHQEDFCQALGVLPDNKYADHGGPSTPQVIGLLKKTGPAARENVGLFIAMLFFNYLIGAPDAHAKNYSLLLDEVQSPRLAPLYDVASILPYVGPHDKVRLAMSIGGENRLGHVGANAIKKFVEQEGLDGLGFSPESCCNLMAGLAQEIPGKLQQIFAEEAAIPHISELEKRFVKPVSQICETTLRLL